MGHWKGKYSGECIKMARTKIVIQEAFAMARRGGWVWLAVVFFMVAVSGVFSADAPEFRITGASGEVGVQPPDGDHVSPATTDFPVSEGDRIVTGSSGRAELATSDGTILQLKENSTFVVRRLTPTRSRFSLLVGKLLAKFSSRPDHTYRIGTPVAVASVRGTELAVVVTEEEEVQAGVIEGEVGFSAADATESGDAEGEPSEPIEENLNASDAPAEETVVGSSEGIIVRPGEKIARMASLPPLVVPALREFPHLRDRVRPIRERWKTMDRAAKLQLRQEALRERVQWKVPDRRMRREISPKRPTPKIPERRSLPNRIKPPRRQR